MLKKSVQDVPKESSAVLASTGCFKSPVHRLNFERIYVEYYYRYRAKIKCNRFAIAKSAINFNFTIVSIVILKIYSFKVQTVGRIFEAPCIPMCIGAPILFLGRLYIKSCPLLERI